MLSSDCVTSLVIRVGTTTVLARAGVKRNRSFLQASAKLEGDRGRSSAAVKSTCLARGWRAAKVVTSSKEQLNHRAL